VTVLLFLNIGFSERNWYVVNFCFLEYLLLLCHNLYVVIILLKLFLFRQINDWLAGWLVGWLVG